MHVIKFMYMLINTIAVFGARERLTIFLETVTTIHYLLCTMVRCHNRSVVFVNSVGETGSVSATCYRLVKNFLTKYDNNNLADVLPPQFETENSIKNVMV